MSPASGIQAGEVGQALTRAGIAPGDALLLHCDAMAAAQMTHLPPQERLKALLQAIQAHLGPNGTLVLPTFTYSFTQGQDYDPANTPSQVGLLTERFRQLPGVRRSLDPIFSVAALGARAEELTRGPVAQCFGPDSFFGRLHRLGGKIVCLGCTLQVVTFLHYVERALGVDYRFDKTFRGRLRQHDGAWAESQVVFFARDLGRASESVLMPLQQRLEAAGRLAKTSLGRVALYAVSCADFFAQTSALLAQRPLALIREGNPEPGQPGLPAQGGAA